MTRSGRRALAEGEVDGVGVLLEGGDEGAGAVDSGLPRIVGQRVTDEVRTSTPTMRSGSRSMTTTSYPVDSSCAAEAARPVHAHQMMMWPLRPAIRLSMRRLSRCSRRWPSVTDSTRTPRL